MSRGTSRRLGHLTTVAATSVSVRYGNPRGVSDVAAQIRAQIIVRAAQATIDRVQDRVNHPAADSLRTRPINQWSCLIDGPRGGPGMIYPVNARVLAFTVGGTTVFARKVNGVGLGPLIAAESQRITLSDLDVSGVVVK